MSVRININSPFTNEGANPNENVNYLHCQECLIHLNYKDKYIIVDDEKLVRKLLCLDCYNKKEGNV